MNNLTNSKLTMPLPFYKNLLLFCLAFIFSAQAHAYSNNIQNVHFTNLPGNRVQIAIDLEKPPAEPKSFTIETPSRIAFDFMDTGSKLKRKVLPIGVGVAKSVIAVSVKDRTRVVLNLTTLTPYKTSIEKNRFYITLNSEQTDNDNAESIPSPDEEPVKAPPGNDLSRFEETDTTEAGISKQQLSGRYLKSIDFRRGENGEGRVILELSSDNIPANVRDESGNIIVDLLDTGLPDRLKQSLDVLDFATPIKSIDTKEKGKNVQIIIHSNTRNFEQLAYQTKNIFTIELKPLAKEELEAKIKEKFGYTGEKLSLNFQDIEIRAVLQLLADFTGQNLVVSDTVTGKLTLRLKNVPWDHALDIILKTKALGMRKNGNVLLIAPTEEIAAREKLELEAQQQVEELAPLKSEFIQINYGKAAAMADMIKSDKSTILSSRGSVTIDDRTNTLIVRDTEEILSQIRTLVHKLDKPVRQVLIESRVVIATDGFEDELGVRWGVNNAGTITNGYSGIVSGNNETTSDIATGTFAATPTTNRFAVNLPVSNATSSIAMAVAKLSTGTLLELELSALQSEGKGEVVASPRIVTANQKEAKIENGIEVPYIVVTNGNATVNFRKAVLSLAVTPQITPDDRIILDIKVNKDAVGDYVNVGASSVPSIEKREITTQVLVNNGETIVLGGVYEESQLSKKSRTPFFSDLPLVGNLFKFKSKKNDKSELLVFVTPKIVKDIAGINY